MSAPDRLFKVYGREQGREVMLPGRQFSVVANDGEEILGVYEEQLGGVQLGPVEYQAQREPVGSINVLTVHLSRVPTSMIWVRVGPAQPAAAPPAEREATLRDVVDGIDAMVRRLDNLIRFHSQL